jgi:hypothetical protein
MFRSISFRMQSAAAIKAARFVAINAVSLTFYTAFDARSLERFRAFGIRTPPGAFSLLYALLQNHVKRTLNFLRFYTLLDTKLQ